MQPTNSAQALSALQAAQASAQDPNSILNAQRQQLGVDNAQQTVTGLRGAINNSTKLLSQVAPSVMGRTGSSLVTNAQASKQIQNEQAPISQRLTQEGTDYNQANSDLQNLQQQAQQAASGIYAGQQDKLSYAQNLYNTLYQQERDAQAARQAEADRQEQIREFNASRASKLSGSGGFNLGGAVATAPKAVNPNQPQAQKELTALFKSNNVQSIADNINGIMKSAKNGNGYDQLKLQLLGQYADSPYGNIISRAQQLLKNRTALKSGASGAGRA